MEGLFNRVRIEVERMLANHADPRIATVVDYDPATYTARTMIQPENVETGWLPVLSPWIGDHWGFYAPPVNGDQVLILCQENDREAGLVVARLYSDKQRPLAVEAGEFWLVHRSGSLLKFHNDGRIESTAATDMTLSAPNGTLRLMGKVVQMHATQELRYDCQGHGEVWYPVQRHAYVINEILVNYVITPPEIPE